MAPVSGKAGGYYARNRHNPPGPSGNSYPPPPMRSSLTTTAATLCLSLALVGCGGEEEVVTVPPPPELRFDESVRTAAADPRFAGFRKLVEARTAANRSFREYGRSIGGSPRTDEERTRWFELFGAANDRTAAVSAAMSDPDLSDDDRTAMRLIVVEAESPPAGTSAQ